MTERPFNLPSANIARPPQPEDPFLSTALSRDIDRRRQLIEATIATIAARGFRSATIAAIAEAAGVSAGLVAFHFGDKDGLLEATLLHLVADLHRAHLDRLAAAGGARARILALVDVCLGDAQFDRATAAVWLAFWAEVPFNPRFARLQRLYARRTRSNLAAAYAELAPRPTARRLAAATAALIDGCWLDATLAAKPAGSAERALVAAFIDTQIALARLPLTADPAIGTIP